MSSEANQGYDLEERLGKFGERVIEIAKKVSQNSINNPIVSQLIRAGTSIGANYMEANGASSKQDFRNKIYICKKEAKETMHWLRMLAKAEVRLQAECRRLWKETQEYAKIFSKIGSSLKNKN